MNDSLHEYSDERHHHKHHQQEQHLQASQELQAFQFSLSEQELSATISRVRGFVRVTHIPDGQHGLLRLGDIIIGVGQHHCVGYGRQGVQHLLETSPKPVLVTCLRESGGDPVPEVYVPAITRTGKGQCQSDGCSKRNVGRGFCKAHGGGSRCKWSTCPKSDNGGGFCRAHGGGKRCDLSSCTRPTVAGVNRCTEHDETKQSCQFDNCSNVAQRVGETRFCKKHGGGLRCGLVDCNRPASTRGEKPDMCTLHGGGKRCQAPNCGKLAAKGGLCFAHGGGKRCNVESCDRKVQRDNKCAKHGGVKPCTEPGCDHKAVTKGLCIAHGGGKRCMLDKCPRSAKRAGLCLSHSDQQYSTHVERKSCADSSCPLYSSWETAMCDLHEHARGEQDSLRVAPRTPETVL